jgi:uncharacterized iron-regulated membrane protein
MSPLRLPPRTLKLLWDAHSAAGVAFGIGLFVIFYCGAFSLPRNDLLSWADPELRSQGTPGYLSVEEAVTPILDETPPAPGADVMIVHPFSGRPYYWLRYATSPADTLDRWVSATTGATLPPRGRSKLSEIPYKLHYFAQAGMGGRLLSGLLGVVLLFAVVSGLLIHLRKLPRDWHTVRLRSGPKPALVDVHAVLGVIGLPFTVMFAVTGAFFSLLVVILGPVVFAVFGGEEARLDEALTGVELPAVEVAGVPAPMLPPAELLAALPPAWEGSEIQRLDYHHWGDANAYAVVDGGVPETLASGGRAVLAATTGEVVASRGPHPEDGTALGRTSSALTTLHFVHFAGRGIDALFFLLTLAASAVILTGNVLWLVERRSKDARATPWAHRFLARSTVGVCVGLVAAIPLLMVASRMIPLDVAGRQGWEDGIFFGGWAVLSLLGFLGASPMVATRRLLVLAAVLSLGVPVANGLTTGAWPWVAAELGQWGVVFVDLGMALSGLALAGSAVWIPAGRHRRAVGRRESKRPGTVASDTRMSGV